MLESHRRHTAVHQLTSSDGSVVEYDGDDDFLYHIVSKPSRLNCRRSAQARTIRMAKDARNGSRTTSLAAIVAAAAAVVAVAVAVDVGLV